MQTTFSIIKPDAVKRGNAGKILAIVEGAGFRVVALRMVKLSQAQAEGFYAVHRERPFFASLVKFMTEGPVIVMALERDDAGTLVDKGDRSGCPPAVLSVARGAPPALLALRQEGGTVELVLEGLSPDPEQVAGILDGVIDAVASGGGYR